MSEERLDLRLVPSDLGVAGLGARVLLLASLKDEPPADLSDVGEFLFGLLERMRLASKLRIDESDEDGDLVFRVRGPALEAAARRDPGVVGALAHVVERAAQQLMDEDLTVRIDVPRPERSERRERDDRGGRDGRRREGRGRERGDGGRRRGGDDRGRRGGRRNERDEPEDPRLEKLARDVAEQVRESGEARVLERMSSRDRWVVHNTVKEIDGVTSESIGEADDKRVKITPA